MRLFKSQALEITFWTNPFFERTYFCFAEPLLLNWHQIEGFGLKFNRKTKKY
jgi:hypothetical protein